MTPLGSGSAGFFYRRHHSHRDRHISRSQYDDGRRRAFPGCPPTSAKLIATETERWAKVVKFPGAETH